ncbi:DUF6159 family protein [uncultured Jatrophihabitans sp.]|uniref:DUF6159 family protein n=1 Tax=uncultured Jatrophihabitans sp. TaxID=1610747 RepID=UPI0035CB1457
MTDGVDPYRYGPPEPPATSNPTGKQVVSASWRLLREDRQLLWLPAISTVTGLLAAAAFFVPGYLLGDAVVGHRRAGVYVGAAFAGFALSVISIFFQSALVIGAFERAAGRRPTLGGVLSAAWDRKGQILAWAVVTSTVGAVIRAVEQRLGIVGKLLGFLGGITWAIATFLAVPVLIAERTGPIESVKRSSELIRQTWGTSLRTTLRVGIGATLVSIPLLVVGIVGAAVAEAGSLPLGIVLIVLGFGSFVALLSVIGAITTYARALIYRYATQQPVPGIPTAFFAGTFVPKRRRFRR